MVIKRAGRSLNCSAFLFKMHSSLLLWVSWIRKCSRRKELWIQFVQLAIPMSHPNITNSCMERMRQAVAPSYA